MRRSPVVVALVLAVGALATLKGSPYDRSGQPRDGAFGRSARLSGPRSQAARAPAAIADTVRVGFAKPGGGYTVATISLETYVARVLAGEAARDSAPAALEALAITVRTFALANLGRHRADGFDLCDQTHCQVVRAATAATDRAAMQTAGRVLLHNDAVASVYYSASCGGRTELPSAVWPGAEDPPYLPSRKDDACDGAPAWTAELDRADLARALHAVGFRGTLRRVKIASRDSSGRVARLKLDDVTPDEISGQDLRVAVGRTLGWQYIKSTAFDLSEHDDRYRFTGHGSGHGVGLCVIGSARLAADGKSADAILARYFPGLTISRPLVATMTDARVGPVAPNRPTAGRGGVAAGSSRPAADGTGSAGAGTAARGTTSPSPLPEGASSRSAATGTSAGGTPGASAVDRSTNDPRGTSARTAPGGAAPRGSTATRSPVTPAGPTDVLLSLPDGDQGERAPIEKEALRARQEIARALGIDAPGPVTIRFHPTTDDYERATGQPWFTSGALVRGEIHLLPIAVLRERGVLDRTIRHELVHVMADDALKDRREWVREGAALYFSGAALPAVQQRPAYKPEPQASCPPDEELRRPVSVGALSNAYARARACFARQIAAGKSWREVK
jgi:SpoIID/LytB domain protein